MNKIIKEYKEQIKYFLNNKKYMISIILVAILSYGFTITHYSIGIDDLCFDRYVQGTYILSAKRWGTWALYNLLRITEFTPFWLDFVVALFMVIIAIVLSAFIRKQYGDKIKIWGYIIFSSLLISNPLINQFFIFQSTNLTIVVSNLIVIICGILIFENYFNENKKSINIICGLLLVLPFSMYESCAQTYLVLLFTTIFIKITQGKTSNKKLFKYFCLSITMLILGLIGYFISGKIVLFILEKLDLKEANNAYTTSLWLNEKVRQASLSKKMQVFNKVVIQQLLKGIVGYLPIRIFIILSFTTLILECIQLIKTSKVSRIISVLGIILSNFILIIALVVVLYRTQFSWIVTTAFLGLYLYQTLCNKNTIKYVVNILAILLIIIQTRTLNQYFYNDYKRYEKEKMVANQIGFNVIENCDYENKPILCVARKRRKSGYGLYEINRDNGSLVMGWGINAFKENQVEITKFINEQGFNFKYITKEQVKESYNKFNKLDEETKSQTIIELEDVILINLENYDLL